MMPLLLLPGMMCDARLFSPQIAAFSAQRPVMVCPPIGARNMADLAGMVLAQAPPRFAMAGLSMGGILAMEILRQAPSRVAGLALMDTNPLAEQPHVQARRGPQMDRVRAGGLDQVMRTEMIPLYAAEGQHTPSLDALCLDMARAIGPEAFCDQSLALRDRPDQCETLRGYHGPALVLCGAADRLCPPARHHLMHELMPQSRLVIVEDTGHLPSLQTPDATNAALDQWLKDSDHDT